MVGIEDLDPTFAVADEICVVGGLKVWCLEVDGVEAADEDVMGEGHGAG